MHAEVTTYLYYKRRSLYLCSAKAPLLEVSGNRRLYPLKGTSFDCVYVCLQHVSTVGFFLLFVKNGFVGAFAEVNSDPLKQIRPPVTMNKPLSRRHAWPTSDGGRCNLRGVLKVTLPKWLQSVSYHMAVDNSTLFSLNIDESLTNNAWGNGRWEVGSNEGWGRREGTRGGLEGGREGEGRREGGMERRREGGRVGGREGGREEGMEERMEGRREGGI